MNLNPNRSALIIHSSHYSEEKHTQRSWHTISYQETNKKEAQDVDIVASAVPEMFIVKENRLLPPLFAKMHIDIKDEKERHIEVDYLAHMQRNTNLNTFET